MEGPTGLEAQQGWNAERNETTGEWRISRGWKEEVDGRRGGREERRVGVRDGTGRRQGHLLQMMDTQFVF